MIVAVDRFTAHVANEEATRRAGHLVAPFDLVESLDERRRLFDECRSESEERTWVHRGHLRIIASVTCSSMNLRISSSTPFSTSSHRSGIWLGSRHSLDREERERQARERRTRALPACFLHTFGIETTKYFIIGIVDNNSVWTVWTTFESIDFS